MLKIHKTDLKNSHDLHCDEETQNDGNLSNGTCMQTTRDMLKMENVLIYTNALNEITDSINKWIQMIVFFFK